MAYKVTYTKIIYPLLALVLVVIFFGKILIRPAVAPVPHSYLEIGSHKITVEIAGTPASQTQGLSNHAPLGENQGMLFVFPDKQVRSFWMKEMLFPLDIIWLDGNRIVKISANLPPEGMAPSKAYSSDLPVNYVLEVNAGWVNRAGIKIGEQINYHL
jgi:hypothetical protein